MQQPYVEDIEDLVRDVSAEMTHRLGKIAKWEARVHDLAVECEALDQRVFGSDVPRDAIWEEQAMLLAEKKCRMRELAEKKVRLVERSERVLIAIFNKIREATYHFKIEMEVDNPGSAEQREKLFYQAMGLHHLLGLDHMAGVTNFENPFEKDSDDFDKQMMDYCESGSKASDDYKDSRRGSNAGKPTVAKKNVGRPKTVLKERSNGTLNRSEQSSARIPNKVADKNDKKKKAGMSNYMRKKTERLREQSKMMEAYERRKIEASQRHSFKNGEKDRLTPFSVASSTGEERAGLKRDSSEAPTEFSSSGALEWRDGDSDRASALAASAFADVADDANDYNLDDDDADLMDAFDFCPGALPSPPREIMDALDDSSIFSFGNGFETNPTSDERLSQKNGFDSGERSTPSPAVVSSGKTPTIGDAQHERRKRNFMFGTVSDTSMHGRPRKLTDRAVELVQMNRAKEEKRRADDEQSWCFCKDGSSDSRMIACDGPNCPTLWFHFDCVGLHSEPDGKWFCPGCSSDN
ncbi:unnamed protein product [Caenorhabditis auriculariae]|uniref:PHD-type domain-containing protein n=1 Tax=Caenorhabditis auriculariae TaxID=2777116 RepID=A0A8S1H9Z4_9PELO|nr:unnamed protein product [Caenorhabditis auriculariae]